MAKRKMLFHPDYVREKIRASQLINRLQLRAIEILLRKSIPDLNSFLEMFYYGRLSAQNSGGTAFRAAG
jgi:hypothetical protein